ncbi:MAG: VapC toxin family PIN domain ribonuclease [Candidatus Parabeggiatoa sp. nov. 2]|nr:MAG: hypothetical protein B6247_18640 [Beggiatoa sp. 4572_84]RKZ61467.1 MAG: VapC toxin family PIN domain ribonuclease [Gammaproteobacteria bacterium]HEC84155.1 PIN domain-containing protein [Thioploca sp.]
MDTSAVAKWYINETHSEDFNAWIQTQDECYISSLTMTEFRCLLARRRRAGELSSEDEQQVFAAFEKDIYDEHLIVHPLSEHHAFAAIHLINTLSTVALRALDAMHLSIANDIGAEIIATADRIMAEACRLQGIKVIGFFE